MYEFLKVRYQTDKITKEKLALFIGKFITKEEYNTIVGDDE